MNQSKGKDEDIRRASYKKETTEAEHEKNEKKVKDVRRSLIGKPVDPNSLASGINFPPGIEPEDAKDPGRATPDAPEVDNRSGEKDKR